MYRGATGVQETCSQRDVAYSMFLVGSHTISAFCLQGRTALWDSILLLCYKIKISYGGIVRGMHLGSSALAILPVVEQETED